MPATMYLSHSRISILSLSMFVVGCSVSPDYDRQLGAQNSKMVEFQMGIYSDDEMQTYIDAIGQKLVAQIDTPEFAFQFSIVDDPTPNAFALPGGYIYITRGLLALMNTEDELACVLAHEIIHVTQRHSVKQMKSSILPSLLEVPGNIVGGVLNENLGNLINAPISAGNQLFLSGYSRNHETEADTLGIELAAKAGYQPTSMGEILSRLNTYVEYATKQEVKKSYFDDHPFTPDRVTNIEQVSTSLTLNQYKPIDPLFPSTIDGIIYGENPDKGVFVGNTFLHPTMKFAIDLPENWKHMNQPDSVAAIQKDGNAFVALNIASDKSNAEEIAESFQEELRMRYKAEIDITETKLKSGLVGYTAQLIDESEDTKVFLTQTWVDQNDLTYRVLSVATEELRNEAESSELSFRPAKKSEIEAINEKVVKVITSQNATTLSAIHQKSGSKEDVGLTIVINEISEENEISKGQQVKVVVKQPYAR